MNKKINATTVKEDLEQIQSRCIKKCMNNCINYCKNKCENKCKNNYGLKYIRKN